MLYVGEIEIVCSGGFRHTTNNRMELYAALEAIRASKAQNLEIITDSRYLVNGAAKMKTWKANNWSLDAKNKVANIDLWQALLLAVQGRNVDFTWVKAHDGIAQNEQCDQLAKQAAKNPQKMDVAYEALNPPSSAGA